MTWDFATAAFAGIGFVADVWFIVAGIAGLAVWRTTRAKALDHAR